MAVSCTSIPSQTQDGPSVPVRGGVRILGGEERFRKRKIRLADNIFVILAEIASEKEVVLPITLIILDKEPSLE